MEAKTGSPRARPYCRTAQQLVEVKMSDSWKTAVAKRLKGSKQEARRSGDEPCIGL